MDGAVANGHPAVEHASDQTLLTPHFARANFPIGVESGEPGAGARTARRPVVTPAGAEHEVSVFGAHLNMIDFRTTNSGKLPPDRAVATAVWGEGEETLGARPLQRL